MITTVPVVDLEFPPAVTFTRPSRGRRHRWDDTRFPGWMRGRTISFALSSARTASFAAVAGRA